MSMIPEEVVSQMRAALSVTEPSLDTGIGTTIRKVLDVVGEAIGEVYVDNFFLNRQYDLDAKNGSALDDFVELFGFERQPARRATGSVTFERTGSTDSPVFISQGTRVATGGSSPVLFSTVVPAVLGVGESTVDIPVSAVTAGVNGNVAVGAATRLISNVSGVTNVANLAATTGGVDAEDDEHLRDRFRRTLFRNLAGTEPMYVGVAQEDGRVNHVNVVGVSKRHSERLEIVDGSADSLIQDSRYVYPRSSALAVDLGSSEIAIPGAHYDFDPNNSASSVPEVTSISSSEVPDGIYDLEFDYVSSTSRNDPRDGITNCVDIYVSGERIESATERVVFVDGDVFTNSSSDELYRAKFRRHDDESTPADGNHFVRFGFAPTISLPSTIDIGGETYEEGDDYWAVNDVSEEGLGWGSLSGIEFLSSGNGQTKDLPADGTLFTVVQNFNAVPRDVQRDIERWRILHTDVMVHAVKLLRLDLFMVVILESGSSLSNVEQAAFTAVSDFLETVGFRGVVQVSDLLAVVHGVEGVDAVRFLNSEDDATDYAIHRVAPDGSRLETYDDDQSPARAADVFTGDDTIAVLNDITLVPRAQNTFGAT